MMPQRKRAGSITQEVGRSKIHPATSISVIFIAWFDFAVKNFTFTLNFAGKHFTETRETKNQSSFNSFAVLTKNFNEEVVSRG